METTNNTRSVYELVKANEFAEGYAYTSRAENDFTIALSIKGITLMGLVKLENLIEKEIAESAKKEVVISYYTDHIAELTKVLEAIQRAKLA